MDKGAKKKKETKKKTCKIGGLWIDLKHYPLLAQMETQEQLNHKDKSEDDLENGKVKTKKKSCEKK